MTDAARIGRPHGRKVSIVSLIVVFHNDGTGDTRTGNYDVTVYLNDTALWVGRVEGHQRGDWRDLVCQLSDQIGPMM